MSNPFHLCTFKPGQHRAEAWQAPRGHRVLHVESGDLVLAIAVPKHIDPPHLAAIEEAQRAHPASTPHAVTTIDPDFIDLIK